MDNNNRNINQEQQVEGIIANSSDFSPEKSKKQELEEKKLELEKPWFQKPSFLVPIVGALSSIFILWVTGFFNTKIESLSIKREQLSFETTKLMEIKNELISDSIALENAKKSLQVDTTNLSNKLRDITKVNNSIRIALINNVKEGRQIREANKSLNNEIGKKQNELKKISDSLEIATKPNLKIQLNKVFIYENMDVGIYVVNSGTGTAFFKDVNFYYKGQVFDGNGNDNAKFFERVIDGLGLYKGNLMWEGRHLSNNIDSAGALASGEKYATLKVSPTRQRYFEEFLKAIVGLEIEIIYQSFKGKEFTCRRKFTEVDCQRE